jgi:methanogenic corrinoid protein MtbC1
MTTPDITEMMEPYLQHAIAGDGRAGVATAIELLDRGVPSDSVIVDLLGGSQREVGERWLVNKLTVADEHFASGITQKALDAVSNAIDVPSTDGNVIVACAEGDWHSLPAQMFAELLHSRGFTVAFLGASTPVDHVAGMLRRRRPDALAVSCNLPLFFGGLTRLADAAHAEGIPVIAGGRALGDGPDRAIHLGADAWAAGIADAEPILRTWLHNAPAVAAVPMTSDPAALFSASAPHPRSPPEHSKTYPPPTRPWPAIPPLNWTALGKTSSSSPSSWPPPGSLTIPMYSPTFSDGYKFSSRAGESLSPPFARDSQCSLRTSPGSMTGLASSPSPPWRPSISPANRSATRRSAWRCHLAYRGFAESGGERFVHLHDRRSIKFCTADIVSTSQQRDVDRHESRAPKWLR